MNKAAILLLVVFGYHGLAQKVVRKSVQIPDNNVVRIDARYCYKVEITSWEKHMLEVQATMDGEYSGEIVLRLGTAGSTTEVEAGLTSIFNTPGDKLGAHKVVAVALKVSLPEYQNVEFYGGNGQVWVKGMYEKLRIFLEGGRCTLVGVGQMAEVITRDADIYVMSPAADIHAESKYGTILKQEIPSGSNSLRLYSNSGNIHLLKRE